MPHRGQESWSHSYHLFMNFPTPHMPEVCLIMKICRAGGMDRMDLPISCQSICLITSGVMLNFLSQYASLEAAWVVEYILGIMPYVTLLPSTHICHGSPSTVKCRLDFFATWRCSLALLSIKTFRVAQMSRSSLISS
jgi:hypothetical protein